MTDVSILLWCIISEGIFISFTIFTVCTSVTTGAVYLPISTYISTSLSPSYPSSLTSGPCHNGVKLITKNFPETLMMMLYSTPTCWYTPLSSLSITTMNSDNVPLIFFSEHLMAFQPLRFISIVKFLWIYLFVYLLLFLMDVIILFDGNACLIWLAYILISRYLLIVSVYLVLASFKVIIVTYWDRMTLCCVWLQTC